MYCAFDRVRVRGDVKSGLGEGAGDECLAVDLLGVESVRCWTHRVLTCEVLELMGETTLYNGSGMGQMR